jgi:hypothetical protein
MDSRLEGMKPDAQHQVMLEIVLEQTRNLWRVLETMDDARALAFEANKRVPLDDPGDAHSYLEELIKFYQDWHLKGTDGLELLEKWRGRIGFGQDGLTQYNMPSEGEDG